MITAPVASPPTGIDRECGMQLPLIHLLCDRGADPKCALHAAVSHGEFQAAEALLKLGARIDLPVAAALGRLDDARQSLAPAASEHRHLALCLAAMFGHAEIVRLLLDAGEDPNRYNPVGAHSHSTPLHQAALAGHESVVRLLVERGARVDLRDTVWHGTPADWARHGGRFKVEKYLRELESRRVGE